MLGKMAYLRIQENYSGWGATIGTQAKVGVVPYLDSESLNVNWTEVDRSGKIIGQRVGDESVVSYEENAPAGNWSQQPRIGDIANILMAHFQCATFITDAAVDGVGTFGTFYFVPFDDSPDTSGSAWGTALILAADLGPWGTLCSKTPTSGDLYTINVDEVYRDLAHGAVNGRRFENGIVDTLEITQRAGEDLVFTPNCKFKNVDATYTYTGGAVNAPSNDFGTMCTWDTVIPSHKGTVLFDADGTTFTDCLESLSLTSSWNTTDKKGVGVQGLCTISYGPYSLTGNFEMEFLRNDIYQPKDAGSLYVIYPMSTGTFAFFCPNIRYTPFETNIAGGDTQNHSPTFKAYSTGTYPPINVLLIGTFPVDTISLIESGHVGAA